MRVIYHFAPESKKHGGSIQRHCRGYAEYLPSADYRKPKNEITRRQGSKSVLSECRGVGNREG